MGEDLGTHAYIHIYSLKYFYSYIAILNHAMLYYFHPFSILYFSFEFFGLCLGLHAWFTGTPRTSSLL